MMYNTSYCLLVILIAIDASFAVYCYGCVSTPTSDCFDGVIDSYYHQDCSAQSNVKNSKIISSLTRSTGGINVTAEIKTVCVTVTMKDNNPNVFERGCGYIYQNVDICEYLELVSNVEGCRSCETDFCNIQPGTLDN